MMPHLDGASHRLVAALCALLLALPPMLTASGARAQTPDGGKAPVRSVVVIDVSADTQDHAEIAHDIELRLSKSEGWAMKDLGAILNAGGEVAAQNNIKTAETFRGDGDRAFEAGEFEDAVASYESAAELMEGAFALVRNRRELGELWLKVGAAYFADGDIEGADGAFLDAARFRANGAAHLDGDAFERFTAAEERLRGQDLSAIEVNTEPQHAKVYIDGRFKGLSPITVAGLTPGEHLVTLFRHGYERVTKTIEISEGSEMQSGVTYKMPQARKGLVYTTLIPRLAKEATDAAQDTERLGGEAVSEAGALLGADAVVVLYATGSRDAKKVRLSLFDTRTRKLLNRVEHTVDWSYRNRNAIKALVEETVTFDLVSALGGQKDTDGVDETPLVEQWWLWTIVGAVVVGGVATGVYFATIPDAEPAFGKDGTGAVVLSF